MAIRRANSDDSKLLSELILASAESVRASDFNEQGWSLLEKTNTVAAFERRFRDHGYFALIYEVDGVAAGYIALIDYEKIDHMFVLPEYRKRSIARKLWERADEICKKAGNGSYYWLRASTFAEPVYQALGFRPAGDRVISDGISWRLMEKGVKIENQSVSVISSNEPSVSRSKS